MQDAQQLIESLRQAAARLTTSVALREELVQGMADHLVRLRQQTPGRAPEWYLRACEFHGRVQFQRLQRRPGKADREAVADPAGGQQTMATPGAITTSLEPLEVLDELVARDLEAKVRQRLTPRQSEVFNHLLAGKGLREIGRQLGVSHVAVIKLRNKIIRTGTGLLSAAPPAAPEVARPAPAPGYGAVCQQA